MSGTAASDDPARAQERALLGLLNQVWTDPKVGSAVRKRAKELNPQITIPDEHPVAVQANERMDALEQQNAALQKMLDEQAAERDRRDQETKLREGIGRAQDRFRLTDDGVAGTIKLMQDRQITDPEAAAALFVDSLPKAKPTQGSTILPRGEFNLYGSRSGGDDWNKLLSDRDGFFADVVQSVFDEMPVGG